MKSRFTIGYIYHLEAMRGIEKGDWGLSTTAGTVSTPLLPLSPPPLPIPFPHPFVSLLFFAGKIRQDAMRNFFKELGGSSAACLQSRMGFSAPPGLDPLVKKLSKKSAGERVKSTHF
jgi:hypothetical protein